MRVVVVREYTDKYTGEGHVIGEKLDMTEERFAEIQCLWLIFLMK